MVGVGIRRMDVRLPMGWYQDPGAHRAVTTAAVRHDPDRAGHDGARTKDDLSHHKAIRLKSGIVTAHVYQASILLKNMQSNSLNELTRTGIVAGSNDDTSHHLTASKVNPHPVRRFPIPVTS